eukprot:CAMPEP_0181251260 /NCGR_PEP_ID=MMETSP1096-20121128/46781_1 /TAXON_ID=156174 ORGANISM="Chrysochromulina ericina, Strain CCMP281" /NCGR_SAMPLE_ID=MMETSP1096 /ASSEMBLY_ACC=CAM_ASM_000453 /LENGTH=90 /DNA_ID=CAMNT_0023348829 /DNA_START=184 /DNA_END=457 /DNA_ORIENTATION=+
MTRQPPPHRHWIDSDCQWLTPHGMRMSMLSDRRATQHAAHTRRNPQPRREGHGKIQQEEALNSWDRGAASQRQSSHATAPMLWPTATLMP